ncbi:armadillo-type protein [Tricladium varicosporioides]|nr:armadillo-type protein [Hymenoscyphus varicosporioides]
MPQENKIKHRGRRDKKRRHENEDTDTTSKKRRVSPSAEADPDIQFQETDNAVPALDEHGEIKGEGVASERPFYGMLEDEEQEYFRRADELLEVNNFPSDEERNLFLGNVYREADGKELKIACSQSCSRLMERLILLSSVEQKKKLFGKFAGNYAHLVQHRFASHCCEMLFIQSAPVVTEELTADSKKVEVQAEVEEEEEELGTMESMFLQTLDELEGQMTFLLTDRFASHTLRVLLVILSGRPLEKASTRSLLQSKKKEKIGIANMDTATTELSLSKRAIPESFQFAVEKIISDTIATMDTSFIRVLATHPTGNPTLQLLLELELTNPNTKKGANANQKTIISALLPDEVGEESSSSSVFINGIMYDAIGSRLLETICSFAPGKLFKQIYRSTFKDRIAALARNEISSYVVVKVLNRLSKEDLEEAVDQICPQVQGLVQRSRISILKTLLERCYARRAKRSIERLTMAIAEAYGSDPSTLLLKMACIADINELIKATTILSATETKGEEEEKPVVQPTTPKPSPQQTHGSLLAQTMLSIPGPPMNLLQASLLEQKPETLLALALFTPTSHVLQAALSSPSAVPLPADLTFRRKLINTLAFPSPPPQIDPLLALSLSSPGTHFLDALLFSTSSSATNALFTLTERVALALSKHEIALRESFTGRIVWRNWHLDLFKRRRGEWVNKTKALSAEKEQLKATSGIGAPVQDLEQGATGKALKKRKNKNNDIKAVQVTEGPTEKKSAIQLAREKFTAKKLAGRDVSKEPSKYGRVKSHGTGANQVQSQKVQRISS